MFNFDELDMRLGGGFFPSRLQTPMDRSESMFLIGLGGTGIDCLRTVKTRIFRQVRPSQNMPGMYDRIRFLGIDTDFTEQDAQKPFLPGMQPLTQSEFFMLHPTIPHPTDWMDPEILQNPGLFHTPCCGIRQVTRYRFHNDCDHLRGLLQHQIYYLLHTSPPSQISIHIFSGLCGGMSGCFLDLCYLLRQILAEGRLENVQVFGWLVKPEINLARVPHENEAQRSNMTANAHASMQEIQYYMNLPRNGGRYQDVLNNHLPIDHTCPPVDVCTLLGSNVDLSPPECYADALYVAAEHILHLLLRPDCQEGRAGLQRDNAQVCRNEAQESRTFYCEPNFRDVTATDFSLGYEEAMNWLLGSVITPYPEKEDHAKEAMELFMKRVPCGSAKDLIMLFAHPQISLPDQDTPISSDALITLFKPQLNHFREQLEKDAHRQAQDSFGSFANKVQTALLEILQNGWFSFESVQAISRHFDSLYGFLIDKLHELHAHSRAKEDTLNTARSNYDNRVRRNLFDTNLRRFRDLYYELEDFTQIQIMLIQTEASLHLISEIRNQLPDLLHKHQDAIRNYNQLAEVLRCNQDLLDNQEHYFRQHESLWDANRPLRHTLRNIAATMDETLCRKWLLERLVEPDRPLHQLLEEMAEEGGLFTAANNAVSTVLNAFNNLQIHFLNAEHRLNLHNPQYRPDWGIQETADFYPPQANMGQYLYTPWGAAPPRQACPVPDRYTRLSWIHAIPLSAAVQMAPYEIYAPRHIPAGTDTHAGTRHLGYRIPLPSLIPVSQIPENRVPAYLHDRIQAVEAIYSQSHPWQFLGPFGRIQLPDPNTVQRLAYLWQEAEQAANCLQDWKLRDIREEVLQILKNPPVVPSPYTTEVRGFFDSCETLRIAEKDQILSSLHLVLELMENLQFMKGLQELADFCLHKMTTIPPDYWEI